MNAHLIERLWKRICQPMDGWLFLLTCILFVLGLVVLYSASNENPNRITNKLTFIVFAMTLMWCIANIRPQQLMLFAVPIYVGGLCLLLGVALFGRL